MSNPSFPSLSVPAQRDGGEGEYGAGWATARSDPAAGAGTGGEISSKREAKRLAFYVFWNVLGDHLDRRFLVPRDFEPFFDSPEQVRLLRGDGWRHRRAGRRVHQSAWMYTDVDKGTWYTERVTETRKILLVLWVVC